MEKKENVAQMRILLVLASLIFFFTNLIAQESPIPPIVPLTPNASSLGKYGDFQIGYHTGQPNINIPLYQIDYPSVSVPIGLSYNYNGLKVEEYPGWVGLGWNLNATGVITRQTRSLRDESNGGYNGPNSLGLQLKAYIDAGALSSDPTYETLLMGIANGLKDSEPDMFFFNIPGYSGKFFFDETQSSVTVKMATVIPHQALTIKGYFNYTYNVGGLKGRIDKFEITDAKGVYYLLDIPEEGVRENHDSGQEQDAFGNAWYLSQIVDPKISDVDDRKIAFEYIDRVLYNPPTVSERLIMVYEQYLNPSYYESATVEKILKRITFRNGEINFVEGEERLDWDYSKWTIPPEAYPSPDINPPKVLDRVYISIDNNLIREYDFDYSYFGFDNHRLRLDNLTEKNGSLSKPPYIFSYAAVDKFPRIGNRQDLFSQDHWGYYTGVQQQTLLPSHTATFAPDGDAPEGAQVFFSGNLRVPNPAFAEAGLLKSIQYPTGGSTSFDYEPNEYNGIDAVGYSGFNLCGGNFYKAYEASQEMRLGYIGEGNTLGEHEQVIPFTLTEATCVQVNYNLRNSGCPESSASVHLRKIPGDTYIEVLQSSVGVTIPVAVSQGIHSPGETFTLQPGDYELKAIVEEGVTCSIPNIGWTKASIEVNFNEGSGGTVGIDRTAGGFRIKRMMDCPAGPCSGCVTKYFDYSDPTNSGKSSGRLLNVPGYIHEEQWIIETGAVLTNPETVPVHVLESKSQIPMVSSNGASIGYEYVTIKEESEGEKGKKVLKFTAPSSYPDEGSVVYPYPPLIDNGWKRGEIIGQQDFAIVEGDEVLKLDESRSPFFQSYYSEFVGLKFAQKVIIDYQSFPITPIPAFYHFVPYSIRTGWKKSQFEVKTSHEDNVYLETSTITRFDDTEHLQVTGSEATNSRGEIIYSTYKYPKDVATVAGLTAPEQAGISASPDQTVVIEQQQFRQTELLSTKRILLDGPRITKVQSAVGNTPLVDEVEFTAYDSHGNILSYTTRTGEIRSYLYGYDNTYPIAEAIQASPADIYTESFEIQGGSSFLDPTDGHNLARSGVKVRGSGSYTFPASFQPTASSMMMTYWYWDGSQWIFSGEIPYNTTISSGGTKLDEVRAYPAGSRMTTYTYEPGKGVISVTDANNLTQFYEYDDLGRLAHIRDDEGNVLKSNEYYYK